MDKYKYLLYAQHILHLRKVQRKAFALLSNTLHHSTNPRAGFQELLITALFTGSCALCIFLRVPGMLLQEEVDNIPSENRSWTRCTERH
jgi:hypothetical protein